MVFGWLFGDKKREARAESEALLTRAVEATRARDLPLAERLSRELCTLDPSLADGWNLLGVNLIRRDAADPASRCDAVLAWMRALAVRPGDARASDHLRTELQYPDELIPQLAKHLTDAAPTREDAASALTQIGERAKPALEALVRAAGPEADAAKRVVDRIG